MPPTFGAELTAQGTVPAACEPHFQAASMGGRAAWPPVRLPCGAVERCGAALRGHARDSFVGTGEAA